MIRSRPSLVDDAPVRCDRFSMPPPWDYFLQTLIAAPTTAAPRKSPARGRRVLRAPKITGGEKHDAASQEEAPRTPARETMTVWEFATSQRRHPPQGSAERLATKFASRWRFRVIQPAGAVTAERASSGSRRYRRHPIVCGHGRGKVLGHGNRFESP